jgi:hypothetical protein
MFQPVAFGKVVEVAVDGGAGNAELAGDLADRVCVCSVGSGFVVRRSRCGSGAVTVVMLRAGCTVW